MHKLEARLKTRLGDLPLIVACSGGSDSIALLVLAHAVHPQVEAAHLDHGWRPESGEDAEFVRSLCERLGVPFHLKRLEPGPSPQGLEARGREARYAWLRQLARERGALVATAHTLEDQAETVLMRVLEGSGVAGLAGVRSRPWLIRPLLDVRKAELIDYLKGQPWQEDPTNRDVTRPRAWIRHELLPVLRTRLPRLDEALARLAASAAEDDSLLRRLARRFDPGDLQGLPPALAARVARRAWRALAAEGARLSRLHLEQVYGLKQGSIWLPGGVLVEKSGGLLHWSRGPSQPARTLTVTLAPVMRVGPWVLRSSDTPQPGWTALPRAVARDGLLRFRARRDGDRWGLRPLKRQLHKWGIPPSARTGLWLLVTPQDEVAWVLGQRETPRGLAGEPLLWLKGEPWEPSEAQPMPTLTAPGPVVFSAEAIATRVDELAARIAADTAGQPIHMITVLRGGLLFMSDLARRLDATVTLDFMAVNRHSGQHPQLVKDLDTPLAGKHVLLVEDVVNEGQTLAYVLELLALRQPASLRVASMFVRPSRMAADLKIDYVGLELPDEFVVGYGLDADQLFRNLPYVARYNRQD